MKAPREGSRKAQVYEIFHDKGFDAAVAFALTIGLKAGTVKSWSGTWGRGGKAPLSPARSKGGNGAQGGGTERSTSEREPYSPHYRYGTREAAVRAMIDLARRTVANERAYHVLEEGGKFAVAPASYKPEGPIPQFKRGMTVMDTVIPDSRAIVVEAGPQQSVVKYEDGREQTIPNVYLYEVAPIEKKAATKAR